MLLKNNMLLFMFFLSLMMFLMNFHPFYLSISLLSTSMSLVGLMAYSFYHWLNYILILVYLGGLLVLFVYISSMVPLMKYSLVISFFEVLFFYLLCKPNFNLVLENMTSFEENFIFFSSLKSFLMIFLLFSMFFLVLLLSGKFLTLSSLPLRSI